MDGAHKGNRKFPGCTDRELEAALLTNLTPERRAMIELEISRRKSGESKAFKTPQL